MYTKGFLGELTELNVIVECNGFSSSRLYAFSLQNRPIKAFTLVSQATLECWLTRSLSSLVARSDQIGHSLAGKIRVHTVSVYRLDYGLN